MLNTVANSNKEIINSISESFARMRARHYKRKAENAMPPCPCAKCKSTFWERENDYDWYCFKCGNRGHWEDGRFVQSRNA